MIHRMIRLAITAVVGTTVFALPQIAPAVEPGDVEPNEVVDLRDLLAIRNEFGQTGAPGFIGADIDDSGAVDNTDLLIWRQHFPFVGMVGAPYIFVASPLDGSLIGGDRRPTIVIDYGPTSLNIDPATVQIIVDGVDRTADALISSRNAVVITEQSMGDGPHFVEATIEDVQGTPATARSDFTVTSLTLLPKVFPTSGPAPLTARFLPDVIWADNPPSNYLWDWNNDGTWDNGNIGAFDISARPDPQIHTFNEEGVQIIRFGVYVGATATLTTTTLTIAVTESFASISPSNGAAPLTAFLHGIAADLSDPITLYEWDFDYSGGFSADYSSPANPNTIHTYPTAGVYRPVFRATHQSGAMVEHPIVQQELQVTSANAPLAIAAAAQGSDALTVNFSGSASDNGTIMLYEWDFDNDGAYDFSNPTTGNVSHVFPTAGAKIAAFRATDNDGNSTVDRVRVETFAPAQLEVLDDTVVPTDGENVTIRTTTTIQSTVWLYIKSQDGRIIRTLVDHEVRPAGTYDDQWDGRDSRYEPAHPGAFYAVLEYTYPGRTDTVDLTSTTGGTQYFATRLSPDPGVFNPFADSFWLMSFSIPSASRASLYILPGGSTRVDTPFDNLALGAGQYSYYWAGLTATGQLAPRTSYLWSVNAWTLGDNAVVVKGRPEVLDLTVDPNLYSPTDRVPLDPTASINFRPTNRSALLIKLIRIDNGLTVQTWRTGFLDPLLQSIIWDGRGTNGELLSPGFYNFAILAVDEHGNVSFKRDALMEVRY